MLNGLFVLVFFQFFLKIGSYIYRKNIEKRFLYNVPTRGVFNSLIDRNSAIEDDEVIQNKELAREINYLFYGELVGVFVMITGAIIFILMEP